MMPGIRTEYGKLRKVWPKTGDLIIASDDLLNRSGTDVLIGKGSALFCVESTTPNVTILVIDSRTEKKFWLNAGLVYDAQDDGSWIVRGKFSDALMECWPYLGGG